MVWNYVQKSARATQYTKDDLARAITDFRNQNMTLHRAQRTYNIPKATLHRKRGQKSSTQGRGTCIPIEEERRLAQGLKAMKERSFGLFKKEVLHMLSYKKPNKDTFS